MKTYKHLYAAICTFDNLYWAFRQARRGKRKRPDVAAFEFKGTPHIPHTVIGVP